MKTASFKCCTLIAGRLICCMYRHGCIAHTECPHTLQTCCSCCTVLVAFCTLLQTQVQLGSATTLVLIRVQCQHMISSWRLGSVTYAQESTYCKTGPLFAVLFSCYHSLVAILLLPFSCSQLATGDMTACQCQSQTQCLAVWKADEQHLCEVDFLGQLWAFNRKDSSHDVRVAIQELGG